LTPYFHTTSNLSLNKQVLGEELKQKYLSQSKVLIAGAGGLGCELLKTFALIGFRKIVIVDMDTIELTNLNRQFLFRHKDIGRSKSEVAAEFVKNKLPHVEIEHYNCRLEEKDEDDDEF